MKKILSAAMAFLMALNLASCGQDAGNGGSSAASVPESSASSEAAESAPDTETSDETVCPHTQIDGQEKGSRLERKGQKEAEFLFSPSGSGLGGRHHLHPSGRGVALFSHCEGFVHTKDRGIRLFQPD